MLGEEETVRQAGDFVEARFECGCFCVGFRARLLSSEEQFWIGEALFERGWLPRAHVDVDGHGRLPDHFSGDGKRRGRGRSLAEVRHLRGARSMLGFGSGSGNLRMRNFNDLGMRYLKYLDLRRDISLQWSL